MCSVQDTKKKTVNQVQWHASGLISTAVGNACCLGQLLAAPCAGCYSVVGCACSCTETNTPKRQSDATLDW
jgi:hypothetical protein